MLNQYMNKPHESHSLATKRVLCYLKGTYNYGIEFANHCDVELGGYPNSDWAGDVDDRKSTSGYIFNIGSRPIAWHTKK